jgi:hypothetical protein
MARRPHLVGSRGSRQISAFGAFVRGISRVQRTYRIRIPAGCCSKSSVGFQLLGPREILLTVRGGRSFCCSGQLATTRFWIGRCTKHKHDYVADGFLAVTAASFVLLCSGLLAIAFS